MFFAKREKYLNLADVSPVVRALAQEQFDDYVKKVRFFVDPMICDQLRGVDNLIGLIEEALDELGDE